MKIALVSPYDFSYPGGVTEHIVALASGLRQRGHDVQILAACSGYQSHTFPHIRAVTHSVTTIPIAGTSARVGLSPLSYLRIKKILGQEAFDVIHLQEPLTPSINWLVLKLAQTQSRPVTIGTFHAYHERPNWFYKQARPLFGRLFRKLDGLIAVSPAAHRFAYQMFPGQYHIIPNGIDLNRFGKSQKTSPKRHPSAATQRITVLFVGRLDKRKGFSNLLQAYVKIKPDYPQLHLQVVGPFNPKTSQPFQEFARRHGITDIEFKGYIAPDHLPSFYHDADIFCAPSIGYESFGIVLLEAMAAGLPIVASDIAGYRSVITDGQEGLLVPPAQPESLARALRHLLNQPYYRQAMGQCGRATINQYSWDRVVTKTLSLYRATIRHKFRVYATNLGQISPTEKQKGFEKRRQAKHVKRIRTQIQP